MHIGEAEISTIRQVVIAAMTAHEKSWRAGMSTGLGWGYMREMEDCIKEACKNHNVSLQLAPLIFFAIEGAYNQTQEWAAGPTPQR